MFATRKLAFALRNLRRKSQNRIMPASSQSQMLKHPSVAPALEIKLCNLRTRFAFAVIATIATFAAMSCSGNESGIDQPIAFITESIPGTLSVLNTDGTVSTISNENVSQPKWSPNTARVAFIADTTENNGGRLMIWNRVENSIESVPGDKENVIRHFWAPDSIRISFEAIEDGNSSIYVYSADGSNTEPVLVTSEPVGSLELGNWSGNNEWITIRLVTDEGPGIFRRNVDGVDEVRLTNGNDSEPRYSPNGSSVAFRRRASNGSTDIYTVDATQPTDGVATSANNMTNLTGDEYDFEWSPNSRHIVFVTEKDGNSEIYSLDVETRENRRLTQNRLQDRLPRWSRSGGNILFVSDADGDFDIFTLNFSSGDQRRLHASDESELVADW